MLKFGGFGLKTSFDANALTYITNVEAAGRTLTTNEKNYINTYVLALKSGGVWAQIVDRIIPIWGSSTPSLVTLKGVTTVAAVGSPTFGSTGVAFNGTTQYLTTNRVPSSTTSQHSSYYSQTNATGAFVDIGSSTGSNRFELHLLTATGQISRIYTSTNQVLSNRGGTSAGYGHGSRTASNDHRAYWNGTQTGSTQTNVGGSVPVHAIYIGAANDDGVAISFSTRTCSLASWGLGLSVAEVSADYTATQSFMTSMGIAV